MGSCDPWIAGALERAPTMFADDHAYVAAEKGFDLPGVMAGEAGGAPTRP